MSRLYYPPVAASVDRDLAPQAVPAKGNVYLEKVTKLIPTEIIAGYIAISGLIEKISIAGAAEPVKWLVFSACMVLTPIYLWRLSEKDKPVMAHLVLSTMAYIVWCYAVSGRILVGDLYDPALASILLILFTLFSGIIPLTPSDK